MQSAAILRAEQAILHRLTGLHQFVFDSHIYQLADIFSMLSACVCLKHRVSRVAITQCDALLHRFFPALFQRGGKQFFEFTINWRL